MVASKLLSHLVVLKQLFSAARVILEKDSVCE
jgi:hypothetical protein